jgi:hypothetical protein
MNSVQHLNLLDESMRPRRERFQSTDGLKALLALAAVLVLADVGLNVAAARETRAAREAQQALIALQATPSGANSAPAPDNVAELASLQSRYASRQQVQGAIQSGAAGSLQGYSAYLVALARQSHNLGGRPLWITELAVAPDGNGLDLQGRMTDPRVLPDYLNLLNDEPLFRGRAFAQVSLKALPQPGDLDGLVGNAPATEPAGPAVTEFALHATPVGTAQNVPAGGVR